jgi:hypothetical protein
MTDTARDPLDVRVKQTLWTTSLLALTREPRTTVDELATAAVREFEPAIVGDPEGFERLIRAWLGRAWPELVSRASSIRATPGGPSALRALLVAGIQNRLPDSETRDSDGHTEAGP